MSTKKLSFLAKPLLLALLLAGCTPAPPIPTPLAVSADACSSATALKDPPLDSAFTSDMLLGGGRVQSGDFQFEAYLYCDSGLGPDAAAPESTSVIAGLGVHTAWRYDGADLPGAVELFWGFGQQDQPSGGWDGGLTRSSMGTFTGGINSGEVTSAIAQGTPLQLTIAVKANGAHAGAVLSFELVPSSDGYVPTNIRLESQP
jgi:hypothetical protein